MTTGLPQRNDFVELMIRARSCRHTRPSAAPSTFSACLLSVATTQHASCERCQRSRWSVSATETLNFLCSRSLMLFTMRRLSFSDAHPDRCRSQEITPTINLRLSAHVSCVQRASDFLNNERFNNIPNFDVIEILNADTAL